jgi:large repetitive protein
MQLRRLVTPSVIGAAVLAMVGLAASAHGYPVQHVSLNDGGIWVTDNSPADGSGAVIGRFDKPVGQLAGQLAPKSAASVDVWQNGSLVATYANGPQTGRLYAVDVDQTELDGAGTLVSPVMPDTSGIALSLDPDAASATVAVLSGSTSRSLRTATLGTDGSLDPLSSTAPALDRHLPGDSVIAVGTDNTVWVAGGGQLLDFPAGAISPKKTSLPSSMQATDILQITTVENLPVIADLTTGWLFLPGSGKTSKLPSTAGFELQQASQASAVVVAATSSALYSANLSTGDLSRLSQGESGNAAAPVQVGGCVQAAWADGADGSYVRACGSPLAADNPQTFSTGDPKAQLVFRVNNGEVVLNDTVNGDVFLVDAKVTTVKPKWQQAKTGSQSQTTTTVNSDQFSAHPLNQGVRPGTTTEVHVLDAVRGSSSQTYAVSAVGRPDQPGVTVSVSPDAQTVLATVTTLTTAAHFQYTVDDGRGHSATSTVTLAPRSSGENSAPELKQDYQPPPLSVAAGGTLVIPVIGDWRDGDGDALYLDSASVSASAGSAAVTSGGALSYTAPRVSGDQTVTLSYGVSDGRVSKPTMATLKVSVLGSSSSKSVAPVAEPDAAQAVAGSPVTLQPLANDLPGVDPTNPGATLRLAGALPAVPGASVSTDLATGTVTFTAQRAGDFFLSYTDAYGAAPTAKGTIRVQAVTASGQSQPPVTTPDTAVLHGQQPALVDVLADDSDPQGWLLGVTGATSNTSGVHVAVIDQEWLRISADDPVPGMTATVSYTVSDGKGSATGTVSVSAVAADASADQITTTAAAVTVRAGDSAAVPVLASDASSTSLALALAGQPPTVSPAIAGLVVSAQGTSIRVDAPASATSEEETEVGYVATDADGTTAAGELDMTIMPAPSASHPNQAPEPQEVDTREEAGDTAVIPIPVSGVDPDGDAVTVTGVTVAPTLGRIVAVGPDTVSYQSYPGSTGTDTFTYQVTDPYGLSATAQVRIAVLPAGQPQAPIAVDDVINAPPGVSLHWNVLANDYIAPGDTVTVEPLAKTNTTVPSAVTLDGSYIDVKPVPPAGQQAEVTYGATDGATPSLAQVIVHSVKGAQIPPVANDDIAPTPAAGASSVTVDVLKNDDDPVGGHLTVSWAGNGATVHGSDLTIKLTSYPREVPYQITATDGLTATAVVYVPGRQASAIALRPGAKITVKQDGTLTEPLSGVLTDSKGRQLKITTQADLTASPTSGLAVSVSGESAITLHALGSYSGPGAVAVQVYDGATIQDKDGTVATLTIPVQVGADEPVLHCPASPVQVVQGGAALSYGIGQLCHVSYDPSQAAPHYTVAWAQAASGVSASAPGGTALELSAAGDAKPGAAGTLKITPDGAATGGTVSIEVVPAPLPTGRAATVTAKAGQSVSVDLSRYVTSPLSDPDISVLGATTEATSTATGTVNHSGSRLNVTLDAATSGTLTLAVQVTDLGDQADRAITVAVTVTVTGPPGKPGTPTATTSGTALVVSFTAAAPQGSPVEYYDVYANGTAHQCLASPCTITGLGQGSYTVYVTATNSEGTSPDSTTATAVLKSVPGQVTGVAYVQGAGASTLNNGSNGTVSWTAATGSVTGYELQVSPAADGQTTFTTGDTTSKVIGGLTAGTQYTVTVRAVNAAGDGPWSLGVTFTPAGAPTASGAPTVTAASSGSTSVITVSVASLDVNDNGSPITSYTIYEYYAEPMSGVQPVTSGTKTVTSSSDTVSYTVTNTGYIYQFDVTATNSVGTSSPSSTAGTDVVGNPDPPTGITAKATGSASTIQVSFTTGATNGQPGEGTIEYGINTASETGSVAGNASGGNAETITISNSSALTDGTPVTIYLAVCNGQGKCSSFAGPSGPVTPYGPIGTPTVSATASGNSIHYTWAAPSDGLGETLNVCVAGSCKDYSVSTTGEYSGSETDTYGYSQAETITAQLADTAGQSSTMASATATTAAAPATPGVSVTEHGVQVATSGSCITQTCYSFNVSATNFPASTALSYTCSDSGGVFWSGTTTLGGSTTTSSAGSATWVTDCVHANDGETVTITVTGGGQSGAGNDAT